MYGWVNKYIGIPFVSGGRDETGLDCYGLVRLILCNEYGVSLPLLSGSYTNALDVGETKKLFTDIAPVLVGERIGAPEEAAVALVRSGGCLCHVALFAGDDYIIHCRRRAGTVCERVTSVNIAGAVEGWYRVDKSYCTGKPLFSRTKGV